MAIRGLTQSLSNIGHRLHGTSALFGTHHYTKTNLAAGQQVRSFLSPAPIPIPPFLKDPKTCSLIGAPTSHGQPFLGVCHGPKLLRDAGIRKTLSSLGWRVKDIGDIDIERALIKAEAIPGDYAGPGLCLNTAEVGSICEALALEVNKQASEKKFVLTMGGDHSIGLATVAGILKARPNTGIIWVDAHADINYPGGSLTGNMHGMPLGLLLEGLYPDAAALPGFAWLADFPKFKPEQLCYVGLRDLDVLERSILKKYQIKAFTMQHVDKYGIGKVMEMVTDHLKGRPLHMSYDIDACDPGIAPCTGTAVRGGLNFREANYVAESVFETGMLGSFDIVEVNPDLAKDSSSGCSDTTVSMGMHIVESAMGKRIDG